MIEDGDMDISGLCTCTYVPYVPTWDGGRGSLNDDVFSYLPFSNVLFSPASPKHNHAFFFLFYPALTVIHQLALLPLVER